MAFTITENEALQPEEIQTRLEVAIPPVEIYLFSQKGSRKQLIEILQEVILLEGAISIGLDDIESWLKDAKSIHIADLTDRTKDLTQITAEAAEQLKLQLAGNTPHNLLITLFSEKEHDLGTFRDCMDMANQLANEENSFILGSLAHQQKNRALLIMACT